MENKTGKPGSRTGRYLKYAIGEIFLVVIGILIALSINNWNEVRKNRAQGNIMKQSLKTELNSDLELMKADLEYIQAELKTNRSYARRLSNANSNLDTLAKIVRQEYFLGFNGIQELDKTTFNSMESTGKINLLGNDLASNVQKYYMNREYGTGAIKKNLEIYYNLMEPFMLRYSESNFAISGHLQDEYWESVDLQKLLGMFNGLLTSRLFNSSVRERFLKESIDKTQNLIDQLE